MIIVCNVVKLYYIDEELNNKLYILSCLSREKQINCYHGACDKTKGCICRHCWSGKTCSKYRKFNSAVLFLI